MKQHLLTLLATLALVLPFATAQAHEKQTAGPNGGRVITTPEATIEFLVNADRKVQITFLDKGGKAIPAGAQIIAVTAGERSAPTKLTFVKSGDVLISEQALPAGGSVPTVVQIKSTPEAKAAVEKFNVDVAICPGCKLGEYACTCSH